MDFKHSRMPNLHKNHIWFKGYHSSARVFELIGLHQGRRDKATSTRWSWLVERCVFQIINRRMYSSADRKKERAREEGREVENKGAAGSENLLGGFEWCLFSKQMWQSALWHNSLQMYRKWWPTMETGTAATTTRRTSRKETPKWVSLCVSQSISFSLRSCKLDCFRCPSLCGTVRLF